MGSFLMDIGKFHLPHGETSHSRVTPQIVDSVRFEEPILMRLWKKIWLCRPILETLLTIFAGINLSNSCEARSPYGHTNLTKSFLAVISDEHCLMTQVVSFLKKVTTEERYELCHN